MADKGANFLRNMIDVGRGITSAYVEDLIADDKRVKEEKALARQQQIDDLDKRYKEAQISKMGMDKPPEKPQGFSVSEGQDRYEWDEAGKKYTKVASGQPQTTGDTKPSQVERDFTEYEKLKKETEPNPVETPTMTEPEGGYKMSPTGAPSLEEELKQQKIKILKHRLGLDDVQGMSTDDLQKKKIELVAKFYGQEYTDENGKTKTVDKILAEKMADEILSVVLDDNVASSTNPPGNQGGQQVDPEWKVSFDQFESYEELMKAAEGTNLSDDYLQAAKEYFGVR